MGRLRKRPLRAGRAIVLPREREEFLPRILTKDPKEVRNRAGPRMQFESLESLLSGQEIIINRVLRGRIVA